MVDQPEFKEALQFYVDLVKDAGQEDAASSSFNECLTQYQDGKVAMWYDATVAAGLLEADDSDVKGKNGYAAGAGQGDGRLGLAVVVGAGDPRDLEQGGPRPGSTSRSRPVRSTSSRRGRGSRADGPRSRPAPASRPTRSPSTRRPPPRSPSPRSTRSQSAPIDNPGTTQRPGVPGVQYVGIPEFQDVGNQCTEQFSAVIAGRASIDSALENCQNIASQVGG